VLEFPGARPALVSCSFEGFGNGFYSVIGRKGVIEAPRGIILGLGTRLGEALIVRMDADGVEVKIAHDGLLRSFASPFFNHRTDAYGGSFENRMRLSFEVLEAIRKAIGAKPLGVRICLDEFTPFGSDLDYGLRMVRALEVTGLVDRMDLEVELKRSCR
jgi:hypothetical protein